MQSVIVNYRIRGLGQFPTYKLDNRPFKDLTHFYAVSVGEDHFKDDWVSGYVNFQKSLSSRKVSVLLGDTLQRHTLSCYYNDDENGAYRRSVENGQNWVKRYAPVFSAGLDQDVEIEFLYWDQFKDHPDFPKYLQYIQELQATDPKFQPALDDSISKYMHRTSGREIFCTLEEKRQKSAKYLVEECAVFSMLAQNLSLNGVVYPSKCIKVMTYLLQLVNDKIRKESPFRWLELHPKRVKMQNALNGNRPTQEVRPS